jgi:RNHCP domain
MTREFTCANCGANVPWLHVKCDGYTILHNVCPECLWSVHNTFGADVGRPPCGAMMRGVPIGDKEVMLRCLGCGYMQRGPVDPIPRLAPGLGVYTQAAEYGE